MAMPKMTKERFNKKYEKWINKMYQDYPYPLVVLTNIDIAEYLGVSNEQVTTFFKRKLLNRDKDFRQLFNDTKDMSVSSIADYVGKSYIYIKKHYIRIYGQKKYDAKQKEYSCKHAPKELLQQGRKEGYVKYKYQRLLKYLYTYKSITTSKLKDMFGSKKVYFYLIKNLKQKGYVIEARMLERYEYEYIYKGKSTNIL